ncbi:MAG: Ig-like domain-containing protein [Clostridia bacterium]
MTLKLKKHLSWLLAFAMAMTIIAGIPATVVNAAIDFNLMPVPRIDTTNVGYQIQRTMHLLETSTAQNPNTVRIAVTGQSIVDPPYTGGGNSWCPDLIAWLKVKYPTANIVYKNFGIGGFAGGILLKRVPDDIRSFYPDLTILYVYGGESEFDRILASMRHETQSDIMLLTSHYTGPDASSDGNAVVMFPNLATKYGAELCEIRAPWKKFLDDNALQPSVLLRDTVHLNADGQTVMLELMKQFFVTRTIDDTSPLLSKRIAITPGMWVDGKLSVPFSGNRVELVSGTGTQFPALVRIDGKKPSQYPGSYLRTLEPGGMYATKTGIVRFTGVPGDQNWTVEITKTAPTVEYSLVGSRSTNKQYSVNGAVTCGGVSLDAESFIWNYGTSPVGTKLPFTTYLNGTDTYMGRTKTLISGIVPGNYTLELTAQNPAQIPDIKELVVFDPDTRTQPVYPKSTVTPGPDWTLTEKPAEPTDDPVAVPFAISNGSFESTLNGWTVFFQNAGAPGAIAPVDEPEKFFAVAGDKALRVPGSSAGLNQKLTLKENTIYKLTYYRYGGMEGKRGAEVMLTSDAYNQGPYAYQANQWKPTSFTETGIGDGWVKCEKVYPNILTGFNYMISIRGWAGSTQDCYVDRISVTTPGLIYAAGIAGGTIGSPLSDWLAPEGKVPFLVQNDGAGKNCVDVNEKDAPNFIPLPLLTPGKRYKIKVRVKNAQPDLSGANMGNALQLQLQTTAWDGVPDPGNPTVIYQSGNVPVQLEAKTGTMGLTTDYSEYSVEGVAPVPAKDVPVTFSPYRLQIVLTGAQTTTVQVSALEITELFDAVGVLPEGQPKPTATPTLTPTPSPTPIATPTPTPTLTPVPTATPTPVAVPTPVSVSLNQKSVTLAVGKSVMLVAVLAPLGVTSKLTWTSSNTKVAKVANGKVTAISIGTATISVKTANGKTATCKVTVPVVKVKSVKLNKTTVSIKRGKTYQLKATVSPVNATNQKVTWKSMSTKVATVTSKGLVKGIKKGSTYIYVTTVDGRKTSRCKVTVS